ncbi:signal recognition particle-docking protein FtsY [Lactobacillus taiwanensis]|uniref:signal recognition particle-docking protein FtsY n=1 Tax=Lactobacillus taiwanensis TaxID=508451 RepID=UPI000B9864F8|nr:signal recognition particle-docking protein FtsY [Lactobacillus taiwanensis]OYS20817.1 signal recognition particle-docking protein FtsY [Lactobacillus taiwanensis]OYS23354.1 signal recognition particle-docking protein FtsY [Lactobacillus taiwanensis]OYS24872.1 signal recognition particle-docking protein FtsY [Lactobacillus taiwanensis]OYS26850.1 signal recognition particle-docking protein FtsY [Lactobacillus taiwanensis]OYS29756.1 signal recognition particle-docking protein FtsY [Lactobacil
MGLFDKIKKSLFGHKDEEQEENREKELTEKSNEETQESEEPSEAENVEKNSEEVPDSETEDQSDEENTESEETPGWSDAGSAFEKTQNEAEKPAEEVEDQSEEESEEQEEDIEEVSDSEVEDQDDQESVTAEVTEEEAPEEDEQERYDKGLEETNHSFGARLNAFFAKFRTVDEDFFDELEDLLIESDVGFETAEELTDSLRDEAKLQNAKSHDALKQVIVEKLVDIYDKGGEGKDAKLADDTEAKPNVYLFVGVNGAGKTTTIGKLAKRIKDSGKSVMMVAADTFRAGAVEQLVEWGKRDGVEVITGPEKADPASVVYDGVKKAKEEGVDFLLVDTAGRLQNKVNLMSELDKIKRTIKKILPDQPNEVLLVLDGSTGQNALLQAKDFDKTTKLTGLVLTKLDGSSKGGVVLAIRNEMDLPVKLVGLGEKVDDLADFDAEKFAIGLFQGII